MSKLGIPGALNPPIALAGAVIALGLVVLFGWATGVPLLTRVRPDWVAMQPLAAITFMLAGLALYLFKTRRRRALVAVMLPLIAIPATALFQRWTGRPLGVDVLLFPSEVLSQAELRHPGRMAEITAIEFLLFGIFLAWPRASRTQYRFASKIATLGLLVALVGVAGYVLGAHDLARIGSYMSMAMHTALGFVLLFAGGLVLQRDGNWVHFLLEPSPAAQQTRRLLVYIFGWPLLIGFAISYLDPLIENGRLEVAIYVMCLAVVLGLTAVQSGRRLQWAEAQRDRAMKGLNETQARLGRVLESTLDAVITIDENQRIVFFNPAAEKIFGCTAAEAEGSSIERFIPERFRTAHAEHIRRFDRTSGASRHMAGMRTIVAFREDGREFPIDASISQAETAGKKFFTVILRDISERKKFEDQLRASEEQYRTLFSNMSEGFALGEPIMDDRGNAVDVRFVQVNDAFYQQTGVPRGVEGRPFREYLPQIEPLWLDTYFRVIRTGQPERIESHNADTGRYYDLLAFRPTPGRFAILFRDITDQKRVEMALQESESSLRQLIGALPGMVWSANPAGGIEYFSQQWLDFTGTSLESQLGEGGFQSVYPEDRARVYDAWQTSLRSQVALDVEFRLRRHDGQYRWVGSRGVPLRDAEGRIARWIGIVTDIDDLKRAQDALQDNQRRLAVALQASGSAVWEMDVATGKMRGDDLLFSMLGYEPDELSTIDAWLSLVHPDDAGQIPEPMSELVQGKRDNIRLEFRVRAKDGDWRWLHVQAAAAQRDAQGRALSLIGTHTDIEQRKRMEVRLTESEQKYRTLFSNMTEGFVLGEPVLDDKGRPVDVRFLEVNEAFYQETNIPRGVTGRPLREVLPHLDQFWIERYSTVALTGRPTRFEHHNSDTRRHYDVYAFCPGTGRFAILFRDVTEQKRMEKALQESEAYLRQLIATLPGMVWTATDEGAIDFVSQRWLDYTGTTLGSQLGDGALEAVHPEDRARTAKLWLEAVARRTAFDGEFRVRGHDGNYHWFTSRGTPVLDKEGQICRWLGVAVDIEDLKETQQALQDSEQRYRALFNNKTSAIAHHRVVTDERGNPVDYIIEAVNETYERILGVKREQVEGKMLSDVFPGIWNFDFNPIETFGRIALEGGEGTFEIYFPPNRQWLLTYAYSPKPGEFTAIFTDISVQRETEAALRESEYRLGLALKAGGTAVWDMDVATQRILSADDLLFTMLGYDPGELTTLSQWNALLPEENQQAAMDLFNEVIHGRRGSFWSETRIRAKDGSWHWILSQAIAADRDSNGKAVRLVGAHSDITERKATEQRARDAALHDPLTGLPNRALIFEYGGHLLAAARRRHGRCALLFIDLDRFKPINDIYGHNIGDQVLKEVARRLVDTTRKEDLVGRLGGDEFVILLPHVDSVHHRAAAVAGHVVDSISRPFQIDNLELSLSPSIGISYFPEHAEDVSGLIHTADLAMYQAKQSGRANFQFYSRELDKRAEAAYTLEERLKKALKNGGLALHYQPVVDIRSGKLIGAEALVRLVDGDGNAVGPQSFIPVAESSGLIGEIGEWVATEACRQHELWRGEGLRVTIAVNVSPLQFRQSDFVDRLRRIFSTTGIDPSYIQLEVTESAIMESLDEAVDILNNIKSLGVKVALDDFGTGYSNLSRLSSLPLDKLKVDQSFVRRIETDPTSRVVTEAIIALGRSLKLEVIGEGIESENALHYLQEHGCDQAQGFWFSRPLPAPDFATWYRQRVAA